MSKIETQNTQKNSIMRVQMIVSMLRRSVLARYAFILYSASLILCHQYSFKVKVFFLKSAFKGYFWVHRDFIPMFVRNLSQKEVLLTIKEACEVFCRTLHLIQSYGVLWSVLDVLTSLQNVKLTLLPHQWTASRLQNFVWLFFQYLLSRLRNRKFSLISMSRQCIRVPWDVHLANTWYFKETSANVAGCLT